VPPLISAVVATKDAIVPRDVMLGCAAVSIVAAIFDTVKTPASLKVAVEFCMSLPVVRLKRARASSVAEPGPTTSPAFTVSAAHSTAVAPALTFKT